MYAQRANVITACHKSGTLKAKVGTKVSGRRHGKVHEKNKEEMILKLISSRTFFDVAASGILSAVSACALSLSLSSLGTLRAGRRQALIKHRL